MNRIITLLLATVSFLVLTGCQQLALTKNYKKMIGDTIQFPKSIIGIPNEMAIHDLNTCDIPKMVIWVDSTECSSCRIGNLYRYEELHEQGQVGRFQLVVLFSPISREYSMAAHMVDQHHYDFPVYFDVENAFGNLYDIPSDRRFHAFLLDQNNCICFIGDPTSNAKLSSLFWETINKIQADR